MWSKGSKTMSPVGNRARTSPLTRRVVVWASASTSVSIQGPIGLKVSLFLLRHRVRSSCCQARALTSLPIVQPKTASCASWRVAYRRVRPMTATSSGSASNRPRTPWGFTIAVRWPVSALLAR